MELASSINFGGKRENIFFEDSFNRISFSLTDVTTQDVNALWNAIKPEVYIFGVFGGYEIKPKETKGDTNMIYSFYSPLKKNKVEINHNLNYKTANVFIESPNAEEIESAMLKVIPKQNLENLTLDMER